jgi:hypothetical protein
MGRASVVISSGMTAQSGEVAQSVWGARHEFTPQERAKHRETLTKTRDTRVDHVLGMMIAGTWDGMRSHLSLAAMWSCSRDAVSEYAREAYGISRKLLLLAPEQREEARAHYAATLRRNAELAQEAGDYSAVNRSIELQMRLTGVIEPDVAVNVLVQAQQLTDTELRAQGAAWLASLEPSELETMLTEAARLRSERDAIEAPVCAPALLEANEAAEPNETG